MSEVPWIFSGDRPPLTLGGFTPLPVPLASNLISSLPFPFLPFP